MPLLNRNRSARAQMPKMRADKKIMRHISFFMMTIRAFGRVPLSHLEKPISSAMTINEKPFKNISIGMTVPSAMKFKRGIQIDAVSTSPRRRRSMREHSEGSSTVGFPNVVLQSANRLRAKVPNPLALSIEDTKRREIQIPIKGLEILKEKSDRTNTRELGAI